MITYVTIITLLAFVMAFITTHFYFKNRDLVKQFDFLEDEIKGTLKEEQRNLGVADGGNTLGWVEALIYSLRQIKFARTLTLKEVNNGKQKP